MSTPVTDEKPRKVCVYLPEDLAREAKVEAAREGESLSDWVADALQQKLASKSAGHGAVPGGALATAKRAAQGRKAASSPRRR